MTTGNLTHATTTHAATTTVAATNATAQAGAAPHLLTISPATLWMVAIIAAVCFYAAARLIEWAIVDLTKRGKKRIIFVDDDARSLTVGFVKTGGTIKGHDGQKKDIGENEFVQGDKLFRLEGGAGYAGKWFSWIVNPRHGWNLTLPPVPEAEAAASEGGANVAYRGPRDSETVHKDTFNAVLSLFDPASYYKAVARNEGGDTLTANEENDKWGWVMPVAIVACIALVCLFGMVAYIMVHISSTHGGA